MVVSDDGEPLCEKVLGGLDLDSKTILSRGMGSAKASMAKDAVKEMAMIIVRRRAGVESSRSAGLACLLPLSSVFLYHDGTDDRAGRLANSLLWRYQIPCDLNGQ